MSELDFEINSISLCTSRQYSGEDDFLDKMNGINTVQTRKGAGNKIADIDDDDPFKSELAIAASGILEPLDDRTNSVYCNDIEDDELDAVHVHMNAEYDNLSPLTDVVDEIVSIIGTLNIRHIVFFLIFPFEFDELGLQFEFRKEIDLDLGDARGVRVAPGENEDILIQAAEEGTWIRYSVQPDRKIHEASTEKLLIEELERAEDLAENLQP